MVVDSNESNQAFEKTTMFWFVIGFFVILIGSYVYTAMHSGGKVATADFGNASLKIVKTADSETDLVAGLSVIPELNEGEAFLMQFNEPGSHQIWMKGVKYPIDVMWLDQDLKIIHIVPSMDPKSYPKTFGPGQDSTYVIETKAGFVKDNKIKVGNKVVLK